MLGLPHPYAPLAGWQGWTPSETEAIPRILKALAQHNRIDAAGALYPCAGVYAVAEATGTIRKGDRINLV